MPLPIYLQESDEIAARRYELRKQQAKARHDFLLASDPQYAKEYYHGLEQQRLAEINNSIVENAEKRDSRNIFNQLFNTKPIEAELDDKYAINSDYIEISPNERIERAPLLQKEGYDLFGNKTTLDLSSNNALFYGEVGKPIYPWVDAVLGMPHTEREKKLEKIKEAGQFDWGKGVLKNIRYNYNLLKAKGLNEEAERYLDNVVNDKYKLISTKNLSQQEKDELERKQTEKTGDDYSILNMTPEATERAMNAVSPYFREFKDKKNHLGHKYIDFSDNELREIGQQYKDNLRYYGEPEADRYLQNIVQQRVADNTPLSQRVATAGYSLVTDAVGMMATIAGIVGKLNDFNVKNNSSYNEDRNWFQNYLQGLIDNDVSRWAQGLTQYQTWNPDNVNDDMRLMGGRFAGNMRGVGEDIFSNPGRYLIPEMVRLGGMILGTKGSSTLLSAGSKFATKGLAKTYASAVKALGKETMAAKRGIAKFNRAMETTNSGLNVLNAGIVAMGEGAINALQTYDDALAGNYMALAEHLGLDPNKNRTKEQILTSLTLHDMSSMNMMDASPQSQQSVFAELYAKHEKELEGYTKVIEDEALHASQLDFVVNGAINGPIYMTMTDYVFSPAVRQQIRGSKLNLMNNKKIAARRQANLDAKNAKLVANGKKPIKKLDGAQSPVWSALKGTLGEGLEEYLQNLSTEGAQSASTHYIEEFLKNYTNEDALELFSDAYSELAEPNIKRSAAYWEGIGEAALSRESLESFVLGALGGTFVPSFDVTARNKDNIKNKDGKLKTVWAQRGLKENGKEETGWEAFWRALPIEVTPVSNYRRAQKHNEQLQKYDKEITDRLQSTFGINDLNKMEDMKSLISLFNIQDKKQDAELRRDDFALKNAKLEELVELSILMNRRPNNAAFRTFYKSLETILNTKEGSEDADNLVNLASEKFEGDDMYTDDNGNINKPAVFKQIQKNAKDMLDMLERVKKEDKRLNRIYGDELSIDARKALIYGTVLQEDLGNRFEQVQKEVNETIWNVFGKNANAPSISVDDILRYRNSDNVKNLKVNLTNRRANLEKQLESSKDVEKESIKKQISEIYKNISNLDNLLTDVYVTYIPLEEQKPQSSLNFITAEEIASLTPKQRSKLITKILEKTSSENKTLDPPFEKAQIEQLNRFFESGNAKDPEFASKARDLGRIEEAYERTVDDNIKLQSDPNFLYTQTHKNYSKARAKIMQKRVDKLSNINSQKEFNSAMDQIHSEMNENEWHELQSYIINSGLGEKETFRNWAKSNGLGKRLLKKDIERYLEKALNSQLKSAQDKQAVFADFMSVINIVNGIVESVSDIKDVKGALQEYIETEKAIKDKDKRTLTDEIESILKPLIQQLDNMIDVKANAAETGKPAPIKTKKEQKTRQRKSSDKPSETKEPETKDNPIASEAFKDLENERADKPSKADEEIEKIQIQKENRILQKAQKENTDNLVEILDALNDIVKNDEITDEEIYDRLNEEGLLGRFKGLNTQQLTQLINSENISDRLKELFKQQFDAVANMSNNDEQLETGQVEDIEQGTVDSVNTSNDDKEYDLTNQKRYLYNVAEDHTAKKIQDSSRSQDGVQFLTTDDGNAVGILNEHGALEFVNSGDFADIIRSNPDTKIYFLCWKKDEGLTDDNKLPHPFLAIEHANGDIVMNGKRFQIVGALGYADGSAAIETRVRQKIKRLLSDKKKGKLESEDEDGFIATELYTTKVKQLFAGKYIVNDNNVSDDDDTSNTNQTDVNIEWMQGKPLAIQFYYSSDLGGHPIFNIPNDVDDKDVHELENNNDYDGSVWLYFKVADGRWYPAQVHLKLFNSAEYNYDTYKDTPFMKELLKQAGILYDSSKSENTRLEAKRTIYNLLYFLDRDDNENPLYDIVFDGDKVTVKNTDAGDTLTDPESLIKYLLNSGIDIRVSLHSYHFEKKNNGKSQTPFQGMPIEDFVLQSGILSTSHTVAGNVNGGFSIFEEAPEDRPDRNVTRPIEYKTEQHQQKQEVSVTLDGTTKVYYRIQKGDSFKITDHRETEQGKKISALVNAILDNINVQNELIQYEYSGRNYVAEVEYTDDGKVTVKWTGTNNQYKEHMKEKQKLDDTKKLIDNSTPVQKGEYTAINMSAAFRNYTDTGEKPKDLTATIDIGASGPTIFKFKNCHRITLQDFPGAIVYIGVPINRNGIPFKGTLSVIMCDNNGDVVGFDTFDKNALNSEDPQLVSEQFHRFGIKIQDWLNNLNDNSSTKTSRKTEKKETKKSATEEKRTKKTNSKKGTSSEKTKGKVMPSERAMSTRANIYESEDNWENPANDGLYHDDPDAVRDWINSSVPMKPRPLRPAAAFLEMQLRKQAWNLYKEHSQEVDGWEDYTNEFWDKKEKMEKDEGREICFSEASARLTTEQERAWLNEIGIEDSGFTLQDVRMMCMIKVLNMTMEEGQKWVEKMRSATPNNALEILTDLSQCH